MRSIDYIDLRILDLMILNHDNKQISLELGIPISTIHRRIRRIIEKDLVAPKIQINYHRLGFRICLLHIYLSNGNFDNIIHEISIQKRIITIEIHLGNPDILAEAIYGEGFELLELIKRIKKIKGIENVTWTEKLLEYPVNNKMSFTDF